MAAIFTSCSGIKTGVPTVKQGVFGQVSWTEGNQMPSVGTTAKGNNGPAARTLQIYELTNSTQVEGQSPLYTSVKAKLVATIKSNESGYFQHQLAPGKYSIFTVEDGGKLFASLGDGDGNINSFEVKANELSKFDININYRAAY